MQAHSRTHGRGPPIGEYNADVPRKLSRPRPRQGARLLALRKAAGLSQTELAHLVGEPQPNIAFWELTDKPPRSDVLPKMAKALGVSIEQLLDVDTVIARKYEPAGKISKLFNEVRKLPRRQQDKLLDVVAALIDQYKRKAS